MRIRVACLLACLPAALSAQQAERRVLPASPAAMGLHGYSLVLVAGDMKASGGTDSVPAAARKALTDMQAFLPYKRYELIDAAWMLCCGAFRGPAQGRMRGVGELEYWYSIETYSPTEDGKLMVRFSLRETSDAVHGQGRVGSGVGRGSVSGSGSGGGRSDAARTELMRQLYEAQKERDDAEVQMRRAETMRRSGLMTNADYEAATLRYTRARSRASDLQRQSTTSSSPETVAGRAMTAHSLMDSTFSIAIGETVVIGTSRLKGDQALIALLTAATKTPTGSR